MQIFIDSTDYLIEKTLRQNRQFQSDMFNFFEPLSPLSALRIRF
jgi:hypothetical protein